MAGFSASIEKLINSKITNSTGNSSTELESQKIMTYASTRAASDIPAEGYKVEGNNIYVYTAKGMVAFREEVNGGNTLASYTIYLMNDIDMSTVCSSTARFMGIYRKPNSSIWRNI